MLYEETTTRAEHMQWCKTRALEYLKIGDVSEAIASMVSDLSKHADTAKVGMSPMFMLELIKNDVNSAKHFIEGFN
jgi:hypothetical protein